MKLKENYKNKIKKYRNVGEVDYLTPIVKIEDKIDWINKGDESPIYLWALFGKNDSDDYFECLQVGASIDGRKEIEDDIKKLNSNDNEEILQDSVKEKAVNTQFYKEVYFVPDQKGIDKSAYQYRKIKKDYKTLIFCKIDINQYLGIDDVEIENETLRDIFNLSKAYYAETKFAFDTQSIYWSAYRSGVGMESLKQFMNNGSIE